MHVAEPPFTPCNIAMDLGVRRVARVGAEASLALSSWLYSPCPLTRQAGPAEGLVRRRGTSSVLVASQAVPGCM